MAIKATISTTTSNRIVVANKQEQKNIRTVGLGPSSDALRLVDLNDVDVTDLSDEDTLVFDADSGKFVFQPIIPVTISSTSPMYPIAGKLWWHDVAGRLLIRIDDGDSVQWVDAAPGSPGPQGPAGVDYEHVQISPQSSWTVNHNLGVVPSVTVYSVGGMEVEASIVHISNNQTVISFVTPFAGTARFI
jgi:hypothetical protein